MIDWDALVITPLQTVFGQPVRYTPAAGGGEFVISGVYDEAYRRVDFDEGGAQFVSTSEMPVLGVRLAEFPAPPAQGDRLTIVRTGEVFVVKDMHPDGHGGAKLMLNGAVS